MSPALHVECISAGQGVMKRVGPGKFSCLSGVLILVVFSCEFVCCCIAKRALLGK